MVNLKSQQIIDILIQCLFAGVAQILILLLLLMPNSDSTEIGHRYLTARELLHITHHFQLENTGMCLKEEGNDPPLKHHSKHG